jgi:glutaredoxin
MRIMIIEMISYLYPKRPRIKDVGLLCCSLSYSNHSLFQTMNIRLTSILITSFVSFGLTPSTSIAEPANSNDQQIAMLAKKSKSIVLYGRPDCSRTRNLAQQLSEKRISYVFKNIDSAAESAEMFALMGRANLSIKDSIPLPVVVINKKWLMVNPSIEDLLDTYKK